MDAVIGLLDIEHLLSKRPDQLSGGERQRVAIGRTLLSQTRIAGRVVKIGDIDGSCYVTVDCGEQLDKGQGH